MKRRRPMRQVSERRQAVREQEAVVVPACMERDRYCCFRCGTSRGKLDCHHRLGGGLGPDTMENRVMLHGFGNNLRDADGNVLCHGYVHTESDDAQANGWVISRHDPRPPQQVPVRHWKLGMVFLSASGRVVPEGDVVAWTIDGIEPLTEGDLEQLSEREDP